ncbi:MAG: hypothetical protein ACRDJE_06625 [Dehalococcoidia bacterium]
MHYALTRTNAQSPYHIYGKGDDATEAEKDARDHIREYAADSPPLREYLIVVSREEAEERGLLKPAAPVIWHDELGRYRIEEHDRYHPLPGEQRLRNIFA